MPDRPQLRVSSHLHGLSEILDRWSHQVVTIASLSLVVAVATLGVLRPSLLTSLATSLTRASLESLDWFFLISCTCFIVVSIALALSRFGHITLGRPGEKPEFGTLSWVAMLFAAGMGSGLLFWGVAEPLTHFLNPPPGKEMASAPEIARWSLVITNLHWGIHAWGIYAASALCLGYFSFRKGTTLLASAPIRRTMTGWGGAVLGVLADTIAVLSVALGVAGSLGMGILQLDSGWTTITGTANSSETSETSLLLILGILTACYLLSAGTSLARGIKLLSQLNMALALALVTFILLTGPTGFILNSFVTSLGDYFSNLVSLSTRLYPFSNRLHWSHTWTLTYLIWWIAWAPFVGIFIARISRGRTIRQFVVGVMLIPTLFSIFWFAVFGGSGLYIELFGAGGLGSLVQEQTSAALFAFFAYFPWSTALSILALVLVFIFLVTSADSASFVLGVMTSNGKLEPSPKIKLAWGMVIALITGAALVSGGGVHVLRAVAISGAIPFTAVMLLHLACLAKSLFAESSAKESTDS